MHRPPPHRPDPFGAEPETLLDAHAAAILLRLTAAEVLRLARAGELRFVRVGRAYRFRPSDLERFTRRPEVLA